MGRFPSCISLTFNLIPFYHCPRVPLSIKEDTDPVTWLCPFPALLAYCRRPSSFQRKDEPWQAWCCGMGWGDGRSLEYKDTERRGCVPGASSQTVSQTPHLAQGKAPRANAMDIHHALDARLKAEVGEQTEEARRRPGRERQREVRREGQEGGWGNTE